MNRRPWILHLTVAATCLAGVSCSEQGITLQGAGATFPAPLYKRWFLEFYKAHPDQRVNYQPIGSGAGIRQFSEGLTIFGASDAAMSDSEIKKAKEMAKERGQDHEEVILLPMTAGSIVLCYNLPGVTQEVRLSRKTYVRIFLGEIDQWNDSALRADNPGVDLPDLPITVVRRAEGSGTTYAFTNHLNAVGREVKIKWEPGVSKSVTWKADFIGARGNPGVAAIIQQTAGAIGYLEYGYAELARLPMAVLQNKSGNMIKPTPDSCQAALKGVELPADNRIWIPDPAGEQAYPIVTYTWMLCYSRYNDAAKVEVLKEVLKFGLTKGQEFSAELGYIPLPEDIAQKVLESVDRIQAGPSPVALRALPSFPHGGGP